ncbi:hypothetical protein HYH03_005419 [Edaphochlamys debaryana]|uniref:Ankyrin repeat domain-containing protein n=1 Tax=Edaphochlamys debaryana TaxID=47281 RepID=A0A835Y7S2_9CHLO|nr:hypothetical protein HYH03_005419 [Edaphochlamys debaryana]|eukprot:KAG2496597.1 hypothetical protein HYH03_005419 [Edaphochlamys debaryana]
MPTCRWLAEPGRLSPWMDWRHALAEAAASGSPEAVEWCLSRGAQWSLEAVCAALRGGHTSLVEPALVPSPHSRVASTPSDSPPPPPAPPLLPLPPLLPDAALAAAAEGCGLAALQHLCGLPGAWHDRRAAPWSRAAILAAAVGSPSGDWREKAEWLLAQGCAPRQDHPVMPVLRGAAPLERFAWLASHGFTSLGGDPGPLQAAAAAGNTPVVAFLLALGAQPLGAAVCAAEHGHLDTLELLLQGREPPELPEPVETGSGGAGVGDDPVALAQAAARSGSVAVLAYVVEALGVEQAGGLGPELFSAAAASGSPEVLAWLHERGCAADEFAWEEAAAAGCEDALDVLSGTACPQPADGGPYVLAARNGDLRTCSALLRLGLPLGPPDGSLFARAVWEVGYEGAPLASLRWLLERAGCSVEWAAAEEAQQVRTEAGWDDVLGELGHAGEQQQGRSWATEGPAPESASEAGWRASSGEAGEVAGRGGQAEPGPSGTGGGPSEGSMAGA